MIIHGINTLLLLLLIFLIINLAFQFWLQRETSLTSNLCRSSAGKQWWCYNRIGRLFLLLLPLSSSSSAAAAAAVATFFPCDLRNLQHCYFKSIGLYGGIRLADEIFFYGLCSSYNFVMILYVLVADSASSPGKKSS